MHERVWLREVQSGIFKVSTGRPYFVCEKVSIWLRESRSRPPWKVLSAKKDRQGKKNSYDILYLMHVFEKIVFIIKIVASDVVILGEF